MRKLLSRGRSSYTSRSTYSSFSYYSYRYFIVSYGYISPYYGTYGRYMLVFNYYYNDYDEIDIKSINNGTASASNVTLIIGATIGGFFLFIMIALLFTFCCQAYYNNA